MKVLKEKDNKLKTGLKVLTVCEYCILGIVNHFRRRQQQQPAIAYRCAVGAWFGKSIPELLSSFVI
jgi:hypothetical protein